MCVECHGISLKCHRKCLTHTLQGTIFIQWWKFRSSQIYDTFLSPHVWTWYIVMHYKAFRPTKHWKWMKSQEGPVMWKYFSCHDVIMVYECSVALWPLCTTLISLFPYSYYWSIHMHYSGTQAVVIDRWTSVLFPTLKGYRWTEVICTLIYEKWEISKVIHGLQS